MSRPQPARRPRSRDTLAACRQRGSRLKTARPVAVEMTRRGKRGKLQRQKRVFPSFLRAWKSGKKPKRRISTFPQRRRRLSRTKRKAENRLSKSNILKLQDDSSKVTFLNCLTGAAGAAPAASESPRREALDHGLGGIRGLGATEQPTSAYFPRRFFRCWPRPQVGYQERTDKVKTEGPRKGSFSTGIGDGRHRHAQAELKKQEQIDGGAHRVDAPM